MAVLGSVAEKIARHVPVPVLILCEGGPLRTHVRFDSMSVIRALMPVDSLARALDAIPPAASLVATLCEPQHGQLRLTQIVIVPEDFGETEREEVLHEARQNLEAVGQSVREGPVAHVGPNLHLTLSWVVSMESDESSGWRRMERSVNAGEAEQCDLIAMTTHSATSLHRWVGGSITERVLHATRLPLLIMRPADMVEQERKLRGQGKRPRDNHLGKKATLR